MTDALNEQLSALLDGELPAAESELLMKRLERAPELRGRLGRYALIGEAMRSAAPVVAASPGFADRVAAGLGEPVAPVAASTRRRAAWWRPAAGLGVAASVAAAALLLIGRSPLSSAPGGQTPAVQVAAAAPTRAPSIAELMSADPRARPGSVTGEPASYVTPMPGRGVPSRPASEFANYVVAHAEYSSPLGRRAVLSDLVTEGYAGDQGPAFAEPPGATLFPMPRVTVPGAVPGGDNAGR